MVKYIDVNFRNKSIRVVTFEGKIEMFIYDRNNKLNQIRENQKSILKYLKKQKIDLKKQLEIEELFFMVK